MECQDLPWGLTLGTEHFANAQKTTEGFFTLGKVTAGTERIICYRSRFLGYVPTRWQKMASGTEASLHVNTGHKR
jgi:hypothetical protein